MLKFNPLTPPVIDPQFKPPSIDLYISLPLTKIVFGSFGLNSNPLISVSFIGENIFVQVGVLAVALIHL